MTQAGWRALVRALVCAAALVLAPQMASAQMSDADRAALLKYLNDPKRVEEERKRAAADREMFDAMNAQSAASSAYYAYENQQWPDAFKLASRACNGDNAKGCMVLGKVLTEGRIGAPDPRAGEAAHRKAAAIYAETCKDSSSLRAERCGEAGDFHAIEAVPAVRNAALARTYYTRSRDGYSESCERSGYNCFAAGFMTNGDFTGKPDPARAARLWRRGCDDKEASDTLSSCEELIKLLAYGPAGVQNQTEARKLIEAGPCSAAAPRQGQPARVNKLFCAIVGDFLFDGIGGPANPEMAERLMRYSCEDGQESACQVLAARGLPRDDYKGAVALRDLGLTRSARERFETLCTANNADACNEVGRIDNRETNEAERAKAVRFYGRGCELGNIIACDNQGSALFNRGGEANYAAARPPLRKACDAGDAPACRRLGYMLDEGLGGPADLAEANRLHEIACNGKVALGCFNLARNYQNGRGLAADPARAVALYDKGCELGDRASCNNLAYAIEQGRGAPVDLARARSLYAGACDKGNMTACSNLGRFTRDGLGGGPADPVAARGLFEKACNGRVATACNNWSDSLLSSAGGPTDRARAITLRRFSCFALENSDACTWLNEGGHRDPAEEGIILANSERVDRALPLLREACNANSARGCTALANFTPLDAMNDTERNTLLRKGCNLGDQDGCKLLRMRTQ